MSLNASLATFFKAEESMNRNPTMDLVTNTSSLADTKMQMRVNPTTLHYTITAQLNCWGFSNSCQMAVDVFRLSRSARVRTTDECVIPKISDCSAIQVRAVRRLLRQMNALRRKAAANAKTISPVSRRRKVNIRRNRRPS